MLDSLRKRCNFMDNAVQQLGLQNVEVLWARAEEAGQSQQHREVATCANLQSCHLMHADQKPAEWTG